MNESLELFQRWFWVSLVMLVFYAWLLNFKIRRRQAWLRYTAAESAFWSRLGLPRRLAQLARRFGESKASTLCLWIIVVLFALLMFLNAGAYLYFKHRLPARRPAGSASLPGIYLSSDSRTACARVERV
jgi:hypothetical protein